MKYLLMPEVKGFVGKKAVVVPAGWKAPVPVIYAIDTEMQQAMTRYFQQSGMLPGKATERTQTTLQLTLESAYKKHYGDAIRRYARHYARRFPHLHQADGSLLGFQPEVMCVACQPHEQVTQRRKAYVRATMAEMARGADAQAA